MMRYFVRVDENDQPYRLFRFFVDDLNETLTDEIWYNDEWEPSTAIFGALTTGDMNYDEIDPDTAQKLFPEAFIIRKDGTPQGESGPGVNSVHVDTIMDNGKKKKKKLEPIDTPIVG